jgi:hypothetical protein
MLSWINARAPLQAPLVIATFVMAASASALAWALPSTDPESASMAVELDRVQTVIDDLKARLDLDHNVFATLVPENPVMVSVQRDADGFAMSFERSFLATLGEDELEAVVAHELGHVWIFTHHPYLHTEALANQVAMRVVSRGSLEAVYEKVRARGGLKGHLVRFDGTP